MLNMAPSVLYATALASLASIASASGTLSLSLEKKALQPEELAFLRKRSGGTVQEDVFDVFPWSGGGAYYTNVTVGTPPQVLTVILDSGSSDLYFDASTSEACQDTSSAHTCRGGSFNPSDSSTYHVTVPNGFNTSFGDGSTATGDYSTDVVGVGNVQVANVEFGVATEVNSTTGFAVSLMGVGYSANEAGALTGQGAVYPNMPEVLQQAGVINSRLYSVFLNQLGYPTGNILFGGIDTSMYTGELHTMDILPVAYPDPTTGEVIQVVYQFVVPITGMSINAKGKTTTIFQNATADNELPVLLDTGSAAFIVPQTVFNEVANMFPNLDNFNLEIPCSAANDDITLDIEFGGGITIQVPSSSLVAPLFEPSDNEAVVSSGEAQCLFMLQPDSEGQMLSQQGFLIAGDAVLRSAYVVFDLDNGQISLAQANTSPGASNVKVVPAGADGVASAVGSSADVTASPNSASIAPEITASVSFSASTVSPAVATATGIDAVPENGRVTLSASGGGSGTAGAGSSGSSPTGKNAAASVRPPSTAYLPVAFWLASAVLGFGAFLW